MKKEGDKRAKSLSGLQRLLLLLQPCFGRLDREECSQEKIRQEMPADSRFSFFSRRFQAKKAEKKKKAKLLTKAGGAPAISDFLPLGIQFSLELNSQFFCSRPSFSTI